MEDMIEPMYTFYLFLVSHPNFLCCIEFYMHADALRNHIRNHLRVDISTVQQYRNIIKVTIGAHYLYLQPYEIHNTNG